MDRLAEVRIKHDRVKRFLKEKQFDGVLLSSIANFSWFTAGADTHVEINNKYGIASLLVTESNRYIITNNFEAERIRTEELKGIESEFEFVVVNWYEPTGENDVLKKLTAGKRIGTDSLSEDMMLLDRDFSSLRFQLTEGEIERFRWLGQHSSVAVETVAKELQSGMSEHQIQAAMAEKLMADSMMPVVLLVAADHRNFSYRHPIPTENKFNEYALLVCCARRWGLIASRSRAVYLGKAPEDLTKKQEAVAYVDAVFMAKTKPGAIVGQILEEAKAAYAKVGYPGEWQLMHQGGSVGYDSREYIGFAESKEVVLDHQGFTWNPTIQGTKSEDTILLSTSGERELITLTDDWPTMDVEVDGMMFRRPMILEL